MLDNVKKPKKFKGGVEQTKFYLMARDFSIALRKGNEKPLNAIANRGILAFKSLPSSERQKADSLAIVLQMRALVDKDPAKVLMAIDKIEANIKLSITAREAMLWARIKCYERLNNYDAMMAYLAKIATGKPESWQMEQIYPAVRALPQGQNKLNVVRSIMPGLSKLPSMERRFRVMEIDAMLALGQYEQSYDAAKSFLELYPRAGDGWRVLAVAAGKTGKPFEADNAWKTITERADPRRDLWWEGMLSRAEIRAASTRPKAACEIIEEIVARKSQMPKALEPRVAELTKRVGLQSQCNASAS
jgi:tetratricopeptide (TPR) repeat protein